MSEHTGIDEEELATIAARANDATPGPWHDSSPSSVWSGALCIAQLSSYGVGSGASGLGCGTGTTRATADFIAHAREDVPALVAEVRRLRAPNEPNESDTLVDALRWTLDAVLRFDADATLRFDDIGWARLIKVGGLVGRDIPPRPQLEVS